MAENIFTGATFADKRKSVHEYAPCILCQIAVDRQSVLSCKIQGCRQHRGTSATITHVIKLIDRREVIAELLPLVVKTVVGIIVCIESIAVSVELTLAVGRCYDIVVPMDEAVYTAPRSRAIPKPLSPVPSTSMPLT